MKTCTFSNVLRSQAQTFVSWLNLFVLERSIPTEGKSSCDPVTEKNASPAATISKRQKITIRKKLIECYRISQNWTEETTDGLSQSGEILYSGVNKLTFHHNGEGRFTLEKTFYWAKTHFSANKNHLFHKMIASSIVLSGRARSII